MKKITELDIEDSYNDMASNVKSLNSWPQYYHMLTVEQQRLLWQFADCLDWVVNDDEDY